MRFAAHLYIRTLFSPLMITHAIYLSVLQFFFFVFFASELELRLHYAAAPSNAVAIHTYRSPLDSHILHIINASTYDHFRSVKFDWNCDIVRFERLLWFVSSLRISIFKPSTEDFLFAFCSFLSFF